MKLATAGKAFGYWNKKDNTFQFKLPPGTCKAEISFMGVSGIHEFYFSKNTSETSHVSQEDYDYEKNQKPTSWIGNLQSMVDTPQLLKDPSPGLRT